MANNEIKFAVVQSGYAIFGAGATYDEALFDCIEWVEEVETICQVEDLLVNQHNVVDGDFYMLESDDDEFGDYLKNQGGFEKIDGKWFLA